MTTKVKAATRSKLRIAAKSNVGNIHIVPTKKGWSVKKEGAKRASGTFQSKNEAMARARSYSTDTGSIVVHEKDGTIQKWPN